MRRVAFPPDALRGNVVECFDATADRHESDPALEMAGRTCTFGDLRDRSAALAGGLRKLGLRPDQRVGLFLPNSPEFVMAALAALRAGTPFVPMHPELSPREVGYRLDDAGVKALVTAAELRATAGEAIADSDADPTVVTVGAAETAHDDYAFDALVGTPHTEARADDDVAMQPYTSGTTGRPKGVLYTNRNLRAQSLIGFERTILPADRERFLTPLPLSHIAGFVNRTWQPLIRGGTVYLMDPREWDPAEAMATIERESITKFGAVTTMYVDMVNHEQFAEYDLSSLEEAMEGGDVMPDAVHGQFESVTGVELFEAYGLTETGGGTHAGVDATFGVKPGTIGQPFRATDCKVVDEDGEEVPPGETGELLVRGPHVMAGYYERPEATAEAFTENGYLRTGDLVRRDADNYFEVVGRMSDVVVTGGFNVYPREVEEVIHELPAVEDVAVVGIPDDRRGEAIRAYVVRSSNATLPAEAIRDYCADALASYKHPHEVVFVEALPRTTSGKVKKFELRADAR